MKKLFLILALSMPMALMAQEKKDASVSIPQSENTIRMAAELSKYGYAHNDALSLIQAARLCKQAWRSCGTEPGIRRGYRGASLRF